jgi:hypothetical protein
VKNEMDKIGEIEVRIVGSNGKIELSPDTFDIKELTVLLQNIEDILFPKNKKERPMITYNLEEGSVKNILKTTMQVVIYANALFSQIQQSKSIDFLEPKSAIAFEAIQNQALKKGWNFEFKTSLSRDSKYELRISPETNLTRTQAEWVDAEFYIYGELTDAGGKSTVNIHIDTEDYGILKIFTDKVFLKDQKENMLYKNYGVRVLGRQNPETGEMDSSSLKLVEIIDYNPKYDENYLQKLIDKAKNTWKGIDADKWLSDLRGGYES